MLRVYAMQEDSINEWLRLFCSLADSLQQYRMSGAGGSEKIDPAVTAADSLGIDPVYVEYARQLLAPIMADGCFDKYLGLDFSDGKRECPILEITGYLGTSY